MASMRALRGGAGLERPEIESKRGARERRCGRSEKDLTLPPGETRVETARAKAGGSVARAQSSRPWKVACQVEATWSTVETENLDHEAYVIR
jgi:hypothetical protein